MDACILSPVVIISHTSLTFGSTGSSDRGTIVGVSLSLREDETFSFRKNLLIFRIPGDGQSPTNPVILSAVHDRQSPYILHSVAYLVKAMLHGRRAQVRFRARSLDFKFT
jgi:hypothetical protein